MEGESLSKEYVISLEPKDTSQGSDATMTGNNFRAFES
jgi:hypothetical protein